MSLNTISVVSVAQASSSPHPHMFLWRIKQQAKPLGTAHKINGIYQCKVLKFVYALSLNVYMKAYTLIFVDNQKGVKTTWREDDVARFWLVDRAVNQSKGTIARGDLDLNYRLPMTIKKIKVKVSENIDTLSLTNNTKGYHLSRVHQKTHSLR